MILLALWGKESMFEYTRTVYYCVRILTYVYSILSALTSSLRACVAMITNCENGMCKPLKILYRSKTVELEKMFSVSADGCVHLIVSKFKQCTLSFRSFSYFIRNISKTDAFIVLLFILFSNLPRYTNTVSKIKNRLR